MRRVAPTLCALAFLWACAASVYLLVGSSPAGIARSATLAAGGSEASGMPPPLATVEGVWVAGLLMGIGLLAGVPIAVVLAHPSGHRATAWTVGSSILGFCAISGFFVGLLYLPAALLLLVAGAVGKAEPGAVPYADLRA